MTDQTLVKTGESGETVPCEHCKATDHDTNGHHETGDNPTVTGHHETGAPQK